LVMIVSEVGRHTPGIGGLIASLPLISVLAIVWLWRDADVERIAVHAESTFGTSCRACPCFSCYRPCCDIASGSGRRLGVIGTLLEIDG
jgi:hypothetical protein